MLRTTEPTRDPRINTKLARSTLRVHARYTESSPPSIYGTQLGDTLKEKHIANCGSNKLLLLTLFYQDFMGFGPLIV